jgi:aminoglycoside phosphotransferase (APT) family kinase protein
MRRTGAALEVARTLGCPVPRHELIVDLEDDVVAVVQERLPGRHPERVGAAVIDTLVAANDGFAHLLADRRDVPLPVLQLAGAGQAGQWHETLEQYSSRSRRLLREIERTGHQSDATAGDDLVHPDLTVSNVLLEGDRVTGVVDWNDGAFRGDRRFSLVKLLFDLTWEAAAPGGGRHQVQPSGLRRLEEILHDTVEPDRLRCYWARLTLTMLHWTIRSGDTEVIDLHLQLGERGLT